MIINKPFASHIDQNNQYTTHLHFANGAVKKFYMRGSVAWPDGMKEGFALMAGWDQIEKVVVIFEQFRFWTIPHWSNADGTIHKREDGQGYNLGLSQFIAESLSRYQCASYFYGGQHIDTHTRYGRELYGVATRRLELIEVPYVKEVGPNLLLEKINTVKFTMEADSPLSKSVIQFVNTQAAGAEYDNATLALMTLLAGFEFQPWVDNEIHR